MPNGLYGQYLQKRSQAGKKKRHHRILHNEISLDSEFQLQRKILIF